MKVNADGYVPTFITYKVVDSHIFLEKIQVVY